MKPPKLTPRVDTLILTFSHHFSHVLLTMPGWWKNFNSEWHRLCPTYNQRQQWRDHPIFDFVEPVIERAIALELTQGDEDR